MEYGANVITERRMTIDEKKCQKYWTLKSGQAKKCWSLLTTASRHIVKKNMNCYAVVLLLTLLRWTFTGTSTRRMEQIIPVPGTGYERMAVRCWYIRHRSILIC